MYNISVLIPLSFAEKFKNIVLNKWFKSDDASLTRHSDFNTCAYFTFESDFKEDISYVLKVLDIICPSAMYEVF